jgi:ribulose-5-phosphate 4-epimerase/fuculose-1-phosphate aldolase
MFLTQGHPKCANCISFAHSIDFYGFIPCAANALSIWSANVEPFRALSQEACAFVFDQALFDDEEVEVLSIDGGKRIAAALGNRKFCILRNHGLLTVGRSVEESIGWFVMAERVAEVHVKAPNARPISDEAAAAAASTLAPHPVGWRMFQWVQRSLVPDRSVVD